MEAVLIFFYLLYEVYPLLDSAEMEKSSEYSLSTAPTDKTLDYLLDEQVELAFRYGDSGELTALFIWGCSLNLGLSIIYV